MTYKFDLEKWARTELTLDMRQECYDYEAGLLKGRIEGYNKGYEQSQKDLIEGLDKLIVSMPEEEMAYRAVRGMIKQITKLQGARND